jgi:hypothetical protein
MLDCQTGFTAGTKHYSAGSVVDGQLLVVSLEPSDAANWLVFADD